MHQTLATHLTILRNKYSNDLTGVARVAPALEGRTLPASDDVVYEGERNQYS